MSDDRLENKIDRLENKMDKIVEEIGQVNVTLAKQSVILDEHVRRTNLLEELVQLSRTSVLARLDKLEEPQKWLRTTTKILKWVAGIGTAILALMKLLGR